MKAQHLAKPTIYTSKPTGMSRREKTKQREAQLNISSPLSSSVYPPFGLLAEYRLAFLAAAEVCMVYYLRDPSSRLFSSSLEMWGQHRQIQMISRKP
jgi:hypothetical protein